MNPLKVHDEKSSLYIKYQQCKKCDMTFPKKSGLEIHNSEIHGIPSRKEKRMAKQAKKEMAKQIKFQQIIANINEGIGHFKCSMCRASFQRKSELDSHVTSSHGGTAIY